MKKETVLIVLGIAFLGALYYFFIYKKSEPVASIAIGEPSTGPVTQQGVIMGPPSVNSTATGNSQTATLPVRIGGVDFANYDAAIIPWINQLLPGEKNYAMSILPSIPNADKANWATIINQYWANQTAPPEALTNWWMAFYKKYNINTGAHSSFAGDAQTAYMGTNNFDSAQDAYNPKSIQPLVPVTGSQNADNFTVKGSGGQAYNGFTKKKKGK